MIVSIQTAIFHGHEREAIKDPKQKNDKNFCFECHAHFHPRKKQEERRSA